MSVLLDQLESLQHKRIAVSLKNKTTLHGTLLSFDAKAIVITPNTTIRMKSITTITLDDGRNPRGPSENT